MAIPNAALGLLVKKDLPFMDDPLLVDGRQVTASGTHVLASLDEDGFDSQFNRSQSGKQACWPCPHDQNGICMGYVTVGREMVQ